MLDEKNKILYEHLLVNARFPIKKLAQAINSSQATVINRINYLKEKGYISRYDAIINWQKLSLIKNIYHFKINNLEEIEFFENQKPVFSIISLAGLYNLQVWCFFKTKKQCTEFEKLIKHLKYIKSEIEILEFPSVSIFNKQIKIPLKKIKDKSLKLDKIDIDLIKYLAQGRARDSLLKIGNKLNIPYDKVNYRFKRLERAGYFSRLIAQPGECDLTLQTTVLCIKPNKKINLDELYNNISSINQIVSIAKTKEDTILIHFNSLNFTEYKSKLNEILSIENRNDLEIIFISHWNKIHLNNRYPLEFLLK